MRDAPLKSVVHAPLAAVIAASGGGNVRRAARRRRAALKPQRLRARACFVLRARCQRTHATSQSSDQQREENPLSVERHYASKLLIQ